MAAEKCEELKKALNTKAESDGEPPVKKQRFDTSNIDLCSDYSEEKKIVVIF